MNITDKLTITNEDNMIMMSRYPDKYFDLAIVDPPYGINDKFKGGKSGKMNFNEIVNKGWDNSIPSEEYFNELKRLSKNYIVWGGNYMANLLDNSRCFIVWDKQVSEDFSLAMCELALTSFDKNAKIFKMSVPKTGNKIHPTQKPVELYKWLLDKYAKPGDKILDTHLGSGSIAIACHDYGFELTACELDKDYYDKAIQRIKNHTSQQKLF